MMIVRAAPDTARAQGQHPDEPHQELGRLRAGEDRVMLLIVIDDKQPENEKSGQNAARRLRGRMNIPDGPGLCRGKKGSGRKKTPPTAWRAIVSEGFGGQDEFGAGSHALGHVLALGIWDGQGEEFLMSDIWADTMGNETQVNRHPIGFRVKRILRPYSEGSRRQDAASEPGASGCLRNSGRFIKRVDAAPGLGIRVRRRTDKWKRMRAAI